MLSITINNKSVSLPREFSLRLTWVNPACAMGEIPGDVGLGIEFPVNEINRSILGNPQRFEKYRTGEDRKYPNTEIRFSGILLMAGTLRITNSTHESYSGWLQSDVGVMGEQQREKFITEMEWPEDVEFENKYVATYDDETDDYRVPSVFNYGFWDDKGAEELVKIPYIDENNIPRTREETRTRLLKIFGRDYAFQVNKLNEANTGIVTEGLACVVSPMLHLRYVIKESLRLNQWFIGRNDMYGAGGPGYSLGLFGNMAVYNNFNILSIGYTLEEIQHWFWDADAQIMDYTIEEQMTYDFFELAPFNYSDLLPKMKMKDFLLGLQNSLNMVFWFRPNHKVDIIDRNAIPDATPIDLVGYRVGDWEMGEKQDVTLKFIPEYDKNDKYFGSGFNDLTDRRHDYGEPVATFADLADIEDPKFGELRLVLNTNRIYEYKWKVLVTEDIYSTEDQVDALGWEQVSTGPQPFLFGDADEIEEVKTSVSALQYDTFFPGSFLLSWKAHQKGNTAMLRSLAEDFGLRLIPNALSSNRIFWEGNSGLFNTRWRKWAHFWKQRQPAMASFNLPLNVLVHVVNNIVEPMLDDKGKFIIESIETEIGLNMVGKTTINGFKI